MSERKQPLDGVKAPPVVQVSTISLGTPFSERPPSYVAASNTSLISNTVVKEQYCCLSRQTRTEKTLMCAVAVLSLVVLGLVMLIVTDSHCQAANVVGDHLFGGGVST